MLAALVVKSCQAPLVPVWRSMMKPLSLVEWSAHARLTLPPLSVAVRLLGADGASAGPILLKRIQLKFATVAVLPAVSITSFSSCCPALSATPVLESEVQVVQAPVG